MRAEPLHVIALKVGALVDEAHRGGDGHGDEHDRGRSQDDGKDRDRPPASAAPQREHREHHDQPDGGVQPGGAGEREQDPDRHRGNERELRRRSQPQQARPDDLLEQDQSCRHEEGAVDVRVLEQPLGARPHHESVVTREVDVESHRRKHCREDGGGEVGLHDEPRARRRVDVGPEPEREDRQVQRDREEGGRTVRVHDVDRGEEVQREKRAEQRADRERDLSQREAAGDERDSDHDTEHEVRRRRLEPDECGEQDAERDGAVVAAKRERQRPEQRDSERRHNGRRQRVARKDDRRRRREQPERGRPGKHAQHAPERRRPASCAERLQREDATGHDERVTS